MTPSKSDLSVSDYLLADVIVIGSGIAGCRAAIEAAEYAAGVILVDQNAPGTSGNPATDVTYAAAMPIENPSDGWMRHAEDTLAWGQNLGDGILVSLMARDALRNAWEFERYGLPWARSDDRSFDLVHLDGHSTPRGLHMPLDLERQPQEVIADEAYKHVDIQIVENLYVTNLLFHQGEIVGAIGLLTGSGELLVLTGGSVVLATGGMEGLYRFAPGRGSGIGLAYRAGAELISPEMVQFDADGSIPEHVFSLGGLRVDEQCQTNIPGLYAAGEAVGGVHGARLLPGNRLAAAMALGATAGRAAALARREIPRIKEEGVKEEIIRLQRLMRGAIRRKKEPARFADAVIALNRHMLEAVGPVRNGQALAEINEWLAAYREAWLNRIAFEQDAFSTGDRVDLAELDAILTVAGAVAGAAEMRTESRGVHQREDFPEQSGDWEQVIVAKHEDGTDVFSRVPVSPAIMEFV
jgi:succinate dehydrogenase/fumarate reductase flavoprotein subunit